MKDLKLIKKLREKQGKSLREVSRITGFDFRTVQKYDKKLSFSESSQDKKIFTRIRKVDQYKSIIDTWLTDDLKISHKQRHTAKRIYFRLKDEYPENFEISYTSISRYVKSVKKKLYQPKAYLPLTFGPGTAQVDFGTATYLGNGIEKKCKFLVMTFPYSNAYYFQVFKGENQECFLTGLQNIFIHLGGVPPEIIFDNLSAAVTMRKGERKKTDLFEKFEMHYGFEAVFCNPYSGHEKGNVENKVGYLRRNFMVPIPKIDNFDIYNSEAFELCEKDMQRQHYKKLQTTTELFEEDKNNLSFLNPTVFNILRMFKGRCNKYGKVQYNSKQYSVSPDYSGLEVWLFVTVDKIEIKDEFYYTIVIHRRLYGEENEVMNWLPYLNLIQKRPRALKYIDFFKTLPENWQNLFNSIEGKEQQEVFKIFKEILLQDSMEVAKHVLEEAEKYKTFDSQSLKIMYNRFKDKKVKIVDFVSVNTPDLPEYVAEFSEYNKLIFRRT